MRTNHLRKKKLDDSTSSSRLLVFLIVFLILILLFSGELFQISILKHQYYIALANDQQTMTSNISPKRGSIFAADPQNETGLATLAESIERFAISVTPRNIPKKEYQRLANILEPYLDELSKGELIKIFQRDSMYAPPFRHGLIKEEVEDIAKKVNPDIRINFDQTSGDIIYFTQGLIFLREFHRIYPENNLASHIVGFVNYENEGKYGIEAFANESLKGSLGSVAVEKDNKGRVLQEIGSIKRKNGDSVVLTLDLNIQYYLEKRLARALEDYKAESATAIIMKPETGEVIAMASLPDYNPNEFAKTDYQKFVNPAISSQFEAGSVMKSFTVSAALDLNIVKPETKNDYPGTITIGSYTIHNVQDKAYPKADITGILDNSINTGTVWLASGLGNEHLFNYLTNFGFGKTTGIDLPQEVSGQLPKWEDWREINRATISFGQGDAVTPLQLISGYTAIANDGVLIKPHIIKETVDSFGRSKINKPQVVKEVIKPQTAQTVRKMLQHVVEAGHAKHAAVPGYSIGGKTGTAQIPLDNGGYSEDETIQTFTGFGPVSNPEFVITVILKKPNTTYADSSTVYVFSDLAKFLLNYWQIPPDRK